MIPSKEGHMNVPIPFLNESELEDRMIKKGFSIAQQHRHDLDEYKEHREKMQGRILAKGLYR